MGYSQMIRDKIIGEINNRIYINYSNHINASVQHLLTLINDILDLTKIEASQFDINETVNNVQDVFDSEQVHIKVWS
ncbi:MAG: hypothetical protein ACKVG1_09220 [Rhodospirillales bacterium]